MRLVLVIPAVLLLAASSLAAAQPRTRGGGRPSATRPSAPTTAAGHARPATRGPAPAASSGRRTIGQRPRPVSTGRPLPPPRAPAYATSPRPSRPAAGYRTPYWPYGPYPSYTPYSPYSRYHVPGGGYRRLPGLAPVVILLPGFTTVERTTVYAPGYDDGPYEPGYAPERAPGYEPGYAPERLPPATAPDVRGAPGVPAPTLTVEMPADSLLRVRWAGDDRGVVEVALLVADAARRVLATQSVLDPPYTALFDRPARAAYAGVTLTYADGASMTILQPLAPPARPRDRD
ncbi:MAG TPA: hypothetical protein VFS08_05355 [Gemmatimonadaceae bacterium]|nr:hypothetical protein [Gemmatimonadaceae bacterium]